MFGGNVYDAGAAIATLFDLPFSLYVERFVRIPFVTALAGAFASWIDRPCSRARYRISFDGRPDYSRSGYALFQDCSDKCGTGYHDQPYQLWYEQDV